ncbi:MAG: hypothetical protein WC655_07460, partial [Candidatus Hydrogenedentales bacterium]
MLMDDTRWAPRSAYVGLFFCSFGVLMLEVLLTRIFSFTIWYHLAYLTISTALLGFGAAGSLLSAMPKLLEGDGRRLCALSAAGAGLMLVVAMAVLGPRPLDPQRMLDEPVTFFLGLAGYYVVVTIPFILAGIAVSAPLSKYPGQVNRLYAVDLLGAGLGCVAAVAVLSWMDGAGGVVLCAAVMVGAGACYSAPSRLSAVLGGLALVLVVGASYANQVIDFKPSPSKQMGQTLMEPGAQQVFTRWSPINRVDIFQGSNPAITFWDAFGRGTRSEGVSPNAYQLQYDGHNGSDVFEIRGPDTMRMLDEHFLRTPYLLCEKPEVLIIGVGGGVDILNALRRDAKHVTAVELQPITVELLKGQFAKWTGEQFLRPEVNLVAGEGRHFVRSHDARYDIIQITMTDTFSAQTTGAYVLAESYLYTVEGFEDYLDHLNEDGLVSIVVGDLRFRDETLLPPLATRFTLVARRALQNQGVTDPNAHLMVVARQIDAPASSQSQDQRKPVGAVMLNLLVKRTPFTGDEIARVRTFAEANGFSVRLMPGDTTASPMARLLNMTDPAMEETLSKGVFSLEPVTDDRPFFYHVLRWKSLLAGGLLVWWLIPGSTTGLLMLLIMLIQALVFGSILILFPLIRGARGRISGMHTFGFLLYFLALGLGFLFVEISFVQKYVLFLGYPTYSLSVTIFSLLVFASLGAWLSRLGWGRPRTFLAGLLGTTLLLIGLEIAVLPYVRELLLASSLPIR